MNSTVKKIIFKLYIALVFSCVVAFPSLEVGRLSAAVGRWVIAAAAGYLGAFLFMKYGKIVSDFFTSRLARPEAFLGRLTTGKRLFFFVWLIIVLAWIRPYLALFPGTFGYDAPIQLSQWQGISDMTDQHPVMHTVILGIIYDLGSNIFGSPSGGVALFSALQGLLISGALAYSFYYMRKMGVSFAFLIPALLWVCFNPYLQALSFNCTKDIMFGAFFLLFAVFLHSLLTEETPALSSYIYVALYAVLMCLFRHQGIYILCILSLFTLVAPGKKSGIAKLKLLLTVVGTVLFVMVFGFFCHKILRIVPGDSREMLSVPIQQVASVCNAKLNGINVNISNDELLAVERIIPESALLNYDITCADPVKTFFDTEAFKKDMSEYVKLYLSLGLKNKGSYFTVFRVMTEGYFNADKFWHKDLIYQYSFKDLYDFGVSRRSLDESYLKWLKHVTSESDGESGFIMLTIYNSGVCLFVLGVLFGLCFYRKDYRLWLTLLPMLLFLATLFLGPVALVRYVYPLLLLTPFMFFLLLPRK